MTLNAYTRLVIASKISKNEETGHTELTSFALPLAYCDVISVDLIDSKYPEIVRYKRSSIDISEKRLVDKTLKLLRRRYDYPKYLNIEITKTVPTGHGLGSDVSNAAAVIKAFAKLNKFTLMVDDYYDFASEIGFDIPFFFYNKPAIFSFVEKKYTKLDIKIDPYVLLIFSNHKVSKKELLTEFEQAGHVSEFVMEEVAKASTQNLKTLGEKVVNDFAQLIIQKHPELDEILNDLKKNKVEVSGIAGASSTIYALSDNKKLLQNLAEKYNKLKFKTIITYIHKEGTRK